MAKSSVLEQPAKTLDDLDAFIDECIEAKTPQELATLKTETERIMADSRKRFATSAQPVREKAR
jgi:low affinity Fe/Cu permease